MKTAKKALTGLAALLACASGASAYYHFIHYSSRTSPYLPVAERFDLNSLSNKTVTYYLADQGPAQLALGDTLTGVTSQVRAAARAWNGVETSDLRLAFGGYSSMATIQATPGIDVVFDEVPPGLIALGGPTLRADVSPGTPFVPIVRSVLTLRRDLSQYPSWSEQFFLSVVHEFGHTLGLQHTLSSSVMSTSITRGTTKARPLGADDIAGLSLLYPTRSFSLTTGALSGRVMAGGEGIHLASVVAMAPGGAVVSTLTNPDGTFRIEGVPPGQYVVYAHPLPPAGAAESSPANIVLPLGPDRQPVQPGPPFDTVFFPGAKDPLGAMPLAVAAGQTVENVTFQVQRRAAPAIYAVQTYSFPGPLAVKPATVNRISGRQFLVVSGTGLVTAGAPTRGLTVSVVGGAASVAGVRAYPSDARFLQVDLDLNPFSSEAAHHLVFTLNGDIYVLPAAFQVVSSPAPVVANVSSELAGGGRVAAVSGVGLTADTRFWFDGAAAVRVQEENGRFLLTPPPAPPGHRAVVTALNNDGQSSMFIQGGSPPVYVYDASDMPSAALNPNALPAGIESMVEVVGSNTIFADGQVSVGFGSSDISVKRVFVAGPNRLLLNVAVGPNAIAATTHVTIVSGLQVISQPGAFQVQPANPRLPALTSTVSNPATGQQAIQPGGTATVSVPNLTQAQINNGLLLTLNGDRLTILSAVPGQITFQVPANAAAGPGVLRLQAGQDASLPVVVAIDPPPAQVIAVLATGNLPVDVTRPARQGETLTALVMNLAEGGATVAAGRVKVNVAGMDHNASQVGPVPGPTSIHQVQFVLNAATPGGMQPMTVTIDGRASAVFALPVRQ